MSGTRLEPDPWSSNYLVLRTLAAQLRAEAARRLTGRGELSLVDVGCGSRPYAPVFEPYCNEYVGVDYAEGPHVDVVASAESLPFEDLRFDVLLATQVLEHLPSPQGAVAEWSRVLRSGGVAFVSTHGVMRYHPNPEDYWRWTHAGLARLFEESGDWSRIDVYPNGGTASALAYLTTQQLTGVFLQIRAAVLSAPLVFGLNVGAWKADRAYRRLFPGRPPDLAPNYLVVAVRDGGS